MEKIEKKSKNSMYLLDPELLHEIMRMIATNRLTHNSDIAHFYASDPRVHVGQSGDPVSFVQFRSSVRYYTAKLFKQAIVNVARGMPPFNPDYFPGGVHPAYNPAAYTAEKLFPNPRRKSKKAAAEAEPAVPAEFVPSTKIARDEPPKCPIYDILENKQQSELVNEKKFLVLKFEALGKNIFQIISDVVRYKEFVEAHAAWESGPEPKFKLARRPAHNFSISDTCFDPKYPEIFFNEYEALVVDCAEYMEILGYAVDETHSYLKFFVDEVLPWLAKQK